MEQKGVWAHYNNNNANKITTKRRADALDMARIVGNNKILSSCFIKSIKWIQFIFTKYSNISKKWSAKHVFHFINFIKITKTILNSPLANPFIFKIKNDEVFITFLLLFFS